MDYKFKKCTYDELKVILEKSSFELMGWELIEKEYIDYVERIETKDGEFIALLHYHFDDESKNKMCLAFFEVLERYRKKGHGEKIIKQFLKSHPVKIDVTPKDDYSTLFWERCGLL